MAGTFFTLPAPQKDFVNIFLVFAWEFCIEKWRGFLVNFFWSQFPTKRSTKTPRKIRGKFGAKSEIKFGTKIWKIRGTFVLQLFWPNILWIFCGPVYQETNHKKKHFIYRGRFREVSGANFVTKLRDNFKYWKIQGSLVLQLFWP